MNNKPILFLQNRYLRLLKLIISILIRCITQIKPNRVVCWSYAFTQYSCNPKYISECLLQKYGDKIEIFWIFKKGINTNSIDKRIKIVIFESLRYFFIVNTANIVITNSRTYPTDVFWLKRNGQKYIMTWHSSMGIKKIEKDAEETLTKSYIKKAIYDSSICDLLISGSRFRTEVFKRAFYYNGEILETGTPRNDMLFVNNQNIKEKIYTQYNIYPNSKILLYAPTFRSDYTLDYYDINWDIILSALKEKFGNEFVVLLRLHPNFFKRHIDISSLINYSNVINVTTYHDIQELLVISDILVTDYSSSMFDFSLLNKPCFLYVKDINFYDRGCYFNLNELPFPISLSTKELSDKILSFNKDTYIRNLTHFNTNTIGTYETGTASNSVCKWIELHL
jgi:CDP-glycerol glycerophosphotransferase